MGASAKKKIESSKVSIYAIDLHQETPAPTGLQCVSWKPGAQDGQLKIDLFNFRGACGADWQGEADVLNNEVTLTVNNPGCGVAACGSCIYDWSFEVDDIEIATDYTLVVKVDTCPTDSDIRTIRTKIPANSAEGIACRYADFSAMVEHAETRGKTGTFHMPCGGTTTSGGNAEHGTCVDPLVCIENGDDDWSKAICVHPCETDADCPLPSILSCQDSLCSITQRL